MKKVMQQQIPGQVTLNDLLAELAQKAQQVTKKTVTEFASAKERVMESAEDYLQKGERLTSLAREKFERVLKTYAFGKTEQELYSIDIPSIGRSEKFVADIAKKVVRPLLRQMQTFAPDEPAMQELDALIEIPFTLKGYKDFNDAEKGTTACYVLTHHDKKTADVVCLSIYEKGWRKIDLYGYRCYKHSSRKTKNSMFTRDHSLVCDVAQVLSYLICLTMFDRALRDEEVRPIFQEKWEAHNSWISGIDVDEFKCRGSREHLKACMDKIIEAVTTNPGKIQLPCMRWLRPQDASVKLFQELTGIEDVEILDIEQRRAMDRNKVNENPGYLVIDHHLDAFLYHLDPLRAYDADIEISYNRLLQRRPSAEDPKCTENIPDAWGLPSLYKPQYEDLWPLVYIALEALWEKKSAAAKTAAYLHSLAGKGKDHAKSWQTKKNIPAKVVTAMQASEFNSYFGYVEFDEDVDLSKAGEIADEFIAFKETYLPGFCAEEVTLRFRRLGNHKASGLYYPNIGCLCVDINNPSSFIHEYGHCIDREAQEGSTALSDKPEFHTVYSKYRRLLIDNADKEVGLKKRLNGKSKYNLDYYLLHTESFARCFEMYVTRTLGMSNSICKPVEEDSFAYPNDEKLMELIDGYFGQLFMTLNGQAEEQIAA